MKREAILAAIIVAAVPALGAADSEEFRWNGKLAAGQAIEIKGVNGGITATGTSGGEVELVAVKKGRHSDPRAVKIDVVEHEGGVTICAVYPSVDGKANECAPGKGGRMNTRDNDVNVEFKLSVPAGVRFVGRTVNGGIDARGLSADAEATTVNGGVDLESTGTARAETVNGGITARFGRSDWNGTMKLATVNGGIDVTMPDGLSADVQAATVNGDISTDFPITVVGKFGRRKLSGTVGAGGRLLEMNTVNGGIELKKAAR
jgi:opacity protein-like surface antigen